MKHVVVCGAGGFIASHLVKRLKEEGYWVRGVDVKKPEFAPTAADEFLLLDLRDFEEARRAVAPASRGKIAEVYQLAAEMGGMGFISTAECEIMRNSALINVNMPQAAVEAGVSRYFLSSSVCVYRDMAVGEAELTEDDAYPALTMSTDGKSYSRSACFRPMVGATALRSELPVFRTAMGLRGPGQVDARRHGQLSAARSPKPKTAAWSRCGATAARSDRTLMSRTWSTRWWA